MIYIHSLTVVAYIICRVDRYLSSPSQAINKIPRQFVQVRSYLLGVSFSNPKFVFDRQFSKFFSLCPFFFVRINIFSLTWMWHFRLCPSFRDIYPEKKKPTNSLSHLEELFRPFCSRIQPKSHKHGHPPRGWAPSFRTMLFVSSSLQLNLVSRNTKKTKEKEKKRTYTWPKSRRCWTVARCGQIANTCNLLFLCYKKIDSFTITAIFADLHITMMKNCLYPVSRWTLHLHCTNIPTCCPETWWHAPPGYIASKTGVYKDFPINRPQNLIGMVFPFEQVSPI